MQIFVHWWKELFKSIDGQENNQSYSWFLRLSGFNANWMLQNRNAWIIFILVAEKHDDAII